MRKAIVVGWINKGKEADCGETMKNQLMIKRLEELGVECIQLDFKNWKKTSMGIGKSFSKYLI